MEDGERPRVTWPLTRTRDLHLRLLTRVFFRSLPTRGIGVIQSLRGRRNVTGGSRAPMIRSVGGLMATEYRNIMLPGRIWVRPRPSLCRLVTRTARAEAYREFRDVSSGAVQSPPTRRPKVQRGEKT
jgi:hypothetical protein